MASRWASGNPAVIASWKAHQARDRLNWFIAVLRRFHLIRISCQNFASSQAVKPDSCRTSSGQVPLLYSQSLPEPNQDKHREGTQIEQTVTSADMTKPVFRHGLFLLVGWSPKVWAKFDGYPDDNDYEGLPSHCRCAGFLSLWDNQLPQQQ
jgi:hypothetical protein